MNWDTHEISMVIESEENYYNYLKKHIGNELYFMVVLWVIIGEYNRHGNNVDAAKVNGNEVYKNFCEAIGNENEGWT